MFLKKRKEKYFNYIEILYSDNISDNILMCVFSVSLQIHSDSVPLHLSLPICRKSTKQSPLGPQKGGGGSRQALGTIRKSVLGRGSHGEKLKWLSGVATPAESHVPGFPAPRDLAKILDKWFVIVFQA